MTSAIILGRVSTEDQAEEGTGLAGQIEAGMLHITRRGHTLCTSVGYASEGIDYVPGVFQEDYTGKVAMRPAVLRLFEALEQRPISVVVVHRTSRLGRRGSVQELLEAELRARGVRVEYVTAQFDTSTPTGRAMRRMSGVFDELDYENIIDQLKAGKEQRVKSGGVVLTRPPFGYNKVTEKPPGGKRSTWLEINEEEAAIIRAIFEWYVFGDGQHGPMASTAIAALLTARRVPTRGDSPGGKRYKKPAGVWWDSRVCDILQCETYVGRWYYGKTRLVPAAGDKTRRVRGPEDTRLCIDDPRIIPPIISEELFQAAQARTQMNKERSRRNRKHDYLFSGMLKCDACGMSYCGQTKRIARYRCKGKPTPASGRYTEHPCKMPNFTEAEIDAAVWPWIKGIAIDPESVERKLNARQADADAQNAQVYALIARAEKLIADKKLARDRILALYAEGRLEKDEWIVKDDQYKKEMADQEAERTTLMGQLVKPQYTPAYMADVKVACAHIAYGIEDFTPAEKREAYELLDLHVRLAVEDGWKIAHVDCILDARRLMVGAINSLLTSQQRNNTPIRLSARLVIGPVRAI